MLIYSPTGALLPAAAPSPIHADRLRVGSGLAALFCGLLSARCQALDVSAFSGVNPAGCVTALAAFSEVMPEARP